MSAKLVNWEDIFSKLSYHSSQNENFEIFTRTRAFREK